MIIFDEFIPFERQHIIEIKMSGSMFDWHLNKQTSDMPTTNSIYSFVDDKTVDRPQFTHMFAKEEYKNPKTYGLVEPFLDILEEKTGREFKNRVHRIKANLLYKDSGYPPDCYHIPHRDLSPESSETLLYYVNNSDGDTVLFDDIVPVKTMKVIDRVSPKSGKAILFDSSYFHASSSPRFNDFRIVLNFVFYKR